MKLNWLLPFVLIALTISCNDDINKIGTSIDDTLISIKVDNSLAYTTADSVYSIPAGPVTNRTIIHARSCRYGRLRIYTCRFSYSDETDSQIRFQTGYRRYAGFFGSRTRISAQQLFRRFSDPDASKCISA